MLLLLFLVIPFAQEPSYKQDVLPALIVCFFNSQSLLGETLHQLRVLALGLLQNGDVWIGIFPESEEVLVCTLRLG